MTYFDLNLNLSEEDRAIREAAHKFAKEVMRQLGVKPGQTTADREFTLETVNCLGACALGPVVVLGTGGGGRRLTYCLGAGL